MKQFYVEVNPPQRQKQIIQDIITQEDFSGSKEII